MMGQGMDEADVLPTESASSRSRSGNTSLQRSGSTRSAGVGGATGRRARSASDATAANGGEKHDHEFGFPREELIEMEECLNQVRGHLGKHSLQFLISLVSRAEIVLADFSFFYSKWYIRRDS